jgi:hypothetical protein
VTEAVVTLAVGVVIAALGVGLGILVAPRVGRWADRGEESDDD